MQFHFYDQADKTLFVRDDAESAVWSVDQFSLSLAFPFLADKEIRQGMRVGFSDPDGVFQVFEVRQAKSYEPDHYQEIDAEHIAVAELTDDFFAGEDVTDQTAADALATLLTDTLWQIGAVTASGTSSMDIEMSDVWNLVKAIEKNWNVWITPRITVDSTGITGRYLDIAPAEGVWRGVRLSLAKNADNVGVTYDDAEVKTAMYAFGRQEDEEKVTFTDTEWEATADHPGKPAGQAYLEDPTAKALYGRNGRNRFGYYQNSDIDDPVVLLEKTWESLQTQNSPKVTIDCMVSDLRRMGYADQDIRLHDKVMIELPEIGKTEILDVIQLEVDLLDPTRTQPTIGAYIPNIIYINRETNDKATGGWRGSGQTTAEYLRKEFDTRMEQSDYEIRLRAYQVDLDRTDVTVMRALTQIDLDAHKIETLATGAGTMLDEHGNIVVDEHGNPLFISDVAADFDPNQYYPAGQYINYNNRVWRLIKAHAPYTPWDPENATEEKFGIYSKVLQNADNITLKVAKGDVATQLAVEVGNVTITGGNLTVDGMITAEGLETMDITVASLHADYVSVGNGGVVLDDTGSSVTASSYTMNDYSGDLVDSIKGVQVIASGNNYKLQYKTFSGDTWTDAGTFSRATLMSGTWASGVLTVLPDSAGSSSLYYYLSQGSTSWSGAYGSIPVLYSTEQSGQTQPTGYSFSVYRGGSITAASPVSQQPTGSNLRSVTVGSGGNHTYIKLSSTGYRNNNDYITINY
jgi:phage minor structural protein